MEVESWQYNVAIRIGGTNELIAQFEAGHAGTHVIHTSEMPDVSVRDTIAARVTAGTGADVVSFFYAWQPTWVDQGYIVPLPADQFPADQIAAEFSPLVSASFQDGELYTLPTAVRTLGLFYNKELMAEKGLDPENPPTTIDELIGTGKNQLTMDRVAIERAAPYAGDDAAMTYRLVETLRPELANVPGDPESDALWQGPLRPRSNRAYVPP